MSPAFRVIDSSPRHGSVRCRTVTNPVITCSPVVARATGTFSLCQFLSQLWYRCHARPGILSEDEIFSVMYLPEDRGSVWQ
ncbi:hypothetical protein TNCT_91171 [Trichonephila clavata]|uniref:Uncharacterized protein n=1 Tax=Trichonephila clavata TaxID=2740835 RepID=A0A8X6M2D1_TRICU|nr:hypothetical protein TNCT_91171 [Trichonephila clavata]